MKTQYSNGLVVYNESDLLMRRFLFDTITLQFEKIVKGMNKSFSFFQIESSCLIPNELINSEYTEDKYFKVDEEYSLKPETTPASYDYAKSVFSDGEGLPPICVYQMSKSFRREDDKTSRHMRLKEFYQLEFQCIYSANTKDDYHTRVCDAVLEMFTRLFPERKIQKIPSDRIPHYSESTIDIEIWDEDRWMEVCSMSLRNDFPITYIQSMGHKEMKVVEVAIGMDRLLYLK